MRLLKGNNNEEDTYDRMSGVRAKSYVYRSVD